MSLRAAGRPLGPLETGVRRIADVQLRGPGGPLAARAYWPAPRDAMAPPALLVLLPGGNAECDHLGTVDALCRGACADIGVVVLSLTYRSSAPAPRDAALVDSIAAVHWAADHAAELGADPARLILAGAGTGGRLAAAVSRQAREDGWPVLERQVSIQRGTAESMRRDLARSLRPVLGAG
jgi:acetyl esterase